MAEVAIVVPLMRAHLIAPLVQNIAETTENYRIVVVATGECADAARSLSVDLIEDEGGTYPVRINKAVKATTEPYVLCAADDLLFHDGWFSAAMRVMETVNGVVAVNDLHNMAGVHFLVSRSFIDTFGGVLDQPPGVVFCEAYEHSYCDDELRTTAKLHNRWGFAKDAIVEHMHVGAGKAPMDEVYQAGEASMPQGHAIYTSRAHLWAAS